MVQLYAPDQAVSPLLASTLIEAVRYAGDQLSGLMGYPIQLRGTKVQRLRLEDLPGLREDEDKQVTAVHLAFTGPFEGHVVVSFLPAVATHLVSLLLMEPVADDAALDEMAQSALGEVGNITAAAFLNSIANAVQYIVHPSPPSIVQDMIGALLSNVVLEMALDSTHVLLVHTVFEVNGDTMQGDLMLLPTNQSCTDLERRLEQCS